MTKHAVLDIVPMCFEINAPWAIFGAVLKWCDTAQGVLFEGKTSSDKAFEHLHRAWSTGCVVRSNTARLFMKQDAIQQLKKIRVKSIVKDVGRTSWTCGFRVTDACSQNDALLAEVETAMVNMDETMTFSQPISHVETLRTLVVESERSAMKLRRPEFSHPAEADGKVYSFSTIARLTDCDILGHINNAVYATLAEEFRHYVARKGGYGKGTDSEAALRATQPTVTCSISYIGQARPFDMLSVSTWASPTGEGFDYNFEIRVQGKLITQMKLGVDRSSGAVSRL